MKEVQMVVEGVYSAKAAMELSKKYDVQLPIIEQVNEVLFDGKSADQAVKELMLRDKKLGSIPSALAGRIDPEAAPASSKILSVDRKTQTGYNKVMFSANIG